MRILLASAARKDLTKLDAAIARRVISKLEEYEQNPDPLAFARRLHDDPEGTHRFRIGEWRAKFVVENKSIMITRIRHRSDAYR